MSESSIDATDRHILHLLQEDARANITDIADAVGVSGNTVRNRIEVLEDRGVINGYNIDIDYQKAGLDLHFAFTCTARVSEREELAMQALDIPGVVEVREFMTGRQNVFIEGVGSDVDDITREAEALDGLGLGIEAEALIRGDYSKSLDYFRPADADER